MDTIQEPIRGKTGKRIGIVIVVVLVCLTVGSVWWWMNQEKPLIENESDTIDSVTDTPVIPASPTAAELRENFFASIATVVQEIGTMESNSSVELIAQVEDRLVAIRVPREEQDAYMKIFLAIENLKKDETESVETTRTKILKLISPLLQSSDI